MTYFASPCLKCILILCTFLISFGNGQNAEYPNQANLDGDGGSFQLAWKFDAENITFEYKVTTKGWAGLGFSSNGNMIGADIVVMAVDQSGANYISDRHGPPDKNYYPDEDKHQDYNLLSLSKTDTQIIATFSRKKNTCDPEDYVLIDETVHVIYAKNDAVPVDRNNFAKHSSKGSLSLRLFNPKVDSPNPPEAGAKQVEFTVNQVKIPDDKDTLYWCEIRKFSKPANKTQIIKIEPIIQKENIKVVHHMIVYKCPKNVTDYLGRGHDCFDRSGYPTDKIADVFGACMQQFLAGWAVGGESVTYPQDLGMPLYDDSGDTFLMMELHYNNPGLTKNVVDNSGMRFWLTEKLRKTETAMATFGVPVGGYSQIIPPGAKEFTSYGYCSAECTSDFPKEGIQLIGGLMHTHLAGRKIRLQHYRNGTQLPPILSDEHFDFNYQDYKRTREPVTVLPGDELVAECVYETTNRPNSTYGGYPTRMEMCFIFAEYYPAIYKGFSCLSFHEKFELYGNLTDGGIPDTKDYWTTQRIIEFQNSERNGMHAVGCNRPPLDGSSQGFTMMYQYGYPNVTDPLKPDDECSLATTQAPPSPVTTQNSTPIVTTQKPTPPVTKGAGLMSTSLVLCAISVILVLI